MTRGAQTWPRPATDNQQTSGKRALVWVVDDSPLETELAKRVLEPHHDVDVFADGASAIERISQGNLPDVLVLDLHMPEMSGPEVCHFLRLSHDEGSLPILIFTSTGGRADVLEGLAAGANDFVVKAFDPSELVARVATLVRAKRLHDDVKRSELANRKALEAAEQANRAKDVFLATVSHELRTPLNALLGWARLLGKSDVDPATLKRGLTVIERNAKIQVQLIEDILDISRVVSGKLHLELVPVSVETVIQSAIDSVKPAADAKSLQVELASGPPVRVLGDPDRLQQAVWNVLSNAIKFTPPDGKVVVSVRQCANSIEIEVRDSGIGISAAFLPHVFERFRQQNLTAARVHSGLGLGLALARSILEAHEGSIRAESAGEGQGATFTLVLPDEQAANSSKRESERAPPSASYATPALHGGALAGVDVLIVEDDVDASDLLVVLIEAQNGHARQAFSAKEALELYEQRKPALIVSDIGLPDADGYHLIQTIRQRETGPHVPAVALTAYARREDQRLALAAGFQAHVAKPVEPARLMAVLVALLTGSRKALASEH